MKFRHLFLAPVLVAAIVGCNQRSAQTTAQLEPTTAETPVEAQVVPIDRGNVDFVELALDGSSNESLPLGRGQVIEGKFNVPRSGNVTGFEVQIGNYGNSSIGILSVKLCQGDTCAEGAADLASSTDNAYFYLGLSEPLTLTANQPTTYALTRTSGDNLLAVWTYPSSQATSMTVLPDGSMVPRSLKVGLHYSK